MQISNGPIFQEPTDAGIKHDSNNEHVSRYNYFKAALRLLSTAEKLTLLNKQTKYYPAFTLSPSPNGRQSIRQNMLLKMLLLLFGFLCSSQ